MRDQQSSLTVGDLRHGGGSLFFGVVDHRNLLRTAPMINRPVGRGHVVVIPPKQKAGAETRVVGGGGGGGSGSGMHGASPGFLHAALGWLSIRKAGDRAHMSSSRRPTQNTTCWNKADSSPDGM